MQSEREPEAINAGHASHDFFQVLGVSPARGRGFLPQEDAPGSAPAAIISNGFWHSHFAADPSSLGRTLILDGRPVIIVGILPASFTLPLVYPDPDVWLAGISEPSFVRPEQVRTGAGYLSLVGRLRPGQTVASARAELDTIDAQYRTQFNGFVDAQKLGVSSVPLEESLVGPLRPGLAVLLCAAGFLLRRYWDDPEPKRRVLREEGFLYLGQ